MVTPEDRRAGMRALLNELPPTMEASRQLFGQAAQWQGGAAQLKETSDLLKTLIGCVVVLENRIEVLEGRPGVSYARLSEIMSSFIT